jgi:hypothetical protein
MMLLINSLSVTAVTEVTGFDTKLSDFEITRPLQYHQSALNKVVAFTSQA